jgi:hypothetical protein
MILKCSFIATGPKESRLYALRPLHEISCSYSVQHVTITYQYFISLLVLHIDAYASMLQPLCNLHVESAGLSRCTHASFQ